MMVRLTATLLCLVLTAYRTSAQTMELLEWSFSAPVQDTIAAYISRVPESERGTPFLIWRGLRDGAYEFTVETGNVNSCDSVILSHTNRFVAIRGVAYKILTEEDGLFAVHRWSSLPPPMDPTPLPVTCYVMRHWLFVVRFDLDGRRVQSAEMVF